MENPNLHKEVVTGIVQVIQHIADRKKAGVSSFALSELFEVGFKGRTEDAQTFICEFVKDGVINLKQPDVDAVTNGDYSSLWRSTNKYLKGFGYDSVEPEPISLTK